LTLLIAVIIVFCFTSILTVAGVGAAFAVIPFLFWLGFQLKEAMATVLLLKCLSMSFASKTVIRNNLMNFRTAIPIIIVASVFSPIGAYCTQFVDRNILLWFFAGLLVFATSIMIFYRPQQKTATHSWKQKLSIGLLVGLIAPDISVQQSGGRCGFGVAIKRFSRDRLGRHLSICRWQAMG